MLGQIESVHTVDQTVPGDITNDHGIKQRPGAETGPETDRSLGITQGIRTDIGAIFLCVPKEANRVNGRIVDGRDRSARFVHNGNILQVEDFLGAVCGRARHTRGQVDEIAGTSSD